MTVKENIQHNTYKARSYYLIRTIVKPDMDHIRWLNYMGLSDTAYMLLYHNE